MNKQRRLSRVLLHVSFGLLLLALFGAVAAGRAVAAPQAGVPLPLPDLLIYGTVASSDGTPLGAGTVSAVVNEQTIATAEIGAINGTDYTYLLVVPMGMLPPGSTDSTDGIAVVGDTLSFYVDGEPAYYQDPATTLAVNELAIAAGASGAGLVVDLSLPGAMRYTLGDVNANGARNAADALLTLKYDIGLIIGVTSFPPGPNTVYLPLCDIVENGRCDSSDALRILQCDVGMTGVTCPVDTIAAGRTEQAPTTDAATALRLDVRDGATADTVDVTVSVAAGAELFGAASLELHYDTTQFTALGCRGDSAPGVDLVACNALYAPGVVRFNALATGGADAGATLATVQFQRTAAATTAATGYYFRLIANGVSDIDGNDLPWRLQADAAEPAQTDHRIFLPGVSNGNPAAVDAEQAPAAATDAAVATPTPAATPVDAATVPAADSTPDALHAIYLPAISGNQITATVDSVPAIDLNGIDAPPGADDPPAADPPAPAPPQIVPVAVLPSNDD